MSGVGIDWRGKIRAKKAEQPPGARQIGRPAQPIHDVKPARRKPAVDNGIADRGQPDANRIGDAPATDDVANGLNSDGLIAIHDRWIVQI